MIKASAGGGVKGMRVAWNDNEAREAFRYRRTNLLLTQRAVRRIYLKHPMHDLLILWTYLKTGPCLRLRKRCSTFGTLFYFYNL